jgi:hypothetical protein
MNFLIAGMKAQRDKGGRRVLLGEDTRRTSHAVACQVPVCLSFDFNVTSLYIRM